MDGRRGPLCSPRMRRRPGSAWSIRSCRVVPDLTVAENVFLGTSRQPFGLVDWRAMRRRRAGICRPRHRRRSAAPHGRAAARAAAAGGARARAVLRRAHRHSRRAHLGAVAARGASGCSRCCGGCARRAAASCSSPTSSTTCWRSANASPCSATGGRIATASVRRRRQALGHRPHDRRGTRRTGGELPVGNPAAQSGRMRGRPAGRRAEPRRRVS